MSGCFKDAANPIELLSKSLNRTFYNEIQENSVEIFSIGLDENEAIKSIVSCGVRPLLETGNGYYRAITPERKEGINNFYEQAALTMYNGFAPRMKKYAENGNAQQKRIAAVFYENQN